MEFKHSNHNPKREEKLLKLLNSDMSYEDIGNKFGITKQRINQIAKRHGIKRWEQIKEYKSKIYNNVLQDLNNDLPLNKIYKKYKLNKNIIHPIFYEKQDSLIKRFRDKRDSTIVSNFIGGSTAKVITKRNDKELLDPTKLNGINYIYQINTKNGVKRYPMIGNRGAGECSWDKDVVKFIINKREKSKWTFIKITEELNKKGKRTVTGKQFQTPNVYMKYFNLKRK